MRTVVIPRMRVHAWHGDDTIVPQHPVKNLIDALHDSYGGEACVVMYGTPDSRFPRLGKAALGYYELNPDNPAPTLQSILVDIDYPGHVEPPPTWHETQTALVPWPHGWYRTPNGMRLVFQPKEPVALRYANSYLRQFYDQLTAWGIDADRSKDTWYSLFKAPHALRRELPMDLSGIAPIDWEPEELEHEDVLRVGTIVEQNQPNPEPIKRTDLKGLASRFANDLYEGNIVAPVGERHATYVKVASRIVRDLDTANPAVPFHLLAKSFTTHCKDKPMDELWRICSWVTAVYQGSKEAEREETASTLERTAECMGCTTDEALHRLILDTGSQLYVWDEADEEWTHEIPNTRLLIGTLERACPTLVRDIEESEVLRNHATPCSKVVYSYDDAHEGFHAMSSTYYKRVCRQDPDLKPVYHEGVNRWLTALFADRVEEGMNWLAALPQINKPLCALYIEGPDSIGKGLLARGLARLWSRETALAPYSDLVSNFNDALTVTPLIYADEKVPNDIKSANDSSVFRRAIGNSSFRINRKYMREATLVGYPRVLITANNGSALQIREELTSEDIRAVQIRIGHIAVNSEPKEVLEELAKDLPNIRALVNPWIERGYIAEHVLWLEENRQLKGGNRFLVEGWESQLTQDLPASVGSAGTLAEAICLCIIDGRHLDSVRWFDGSVFVNSNMLAQDWNSIVGSANDKCPPSKARTTALKSLSGDNRRTLRLNTVAAKQARYWQIDAKILDRMAAARNLCVTGDVLEAASRETEPEQTFVFHTQEETA